MNTQNLTHNINVNDKLPNFSLSGIDSFGVEKTYTNEDFLGKALVIYFYPKDDTPGCTKESCNFNLLLPQIHNKANIIGISADNIASHKKFQQKYDLKFPLLSDKDTILAQILGAYKESIIEKLITKGIKRTTFLIDSSGIIRAIWRDVKVDNHDTEVLDAIQKLN
jgi:peroxiredoxin Q/BCP